MNKSSDPIRVAVVDDDAGLRDTLHTMLSRTPELECVGAYPTGESALAELPERAPAVVLMDIHLPGMSGVDACACLRSVCPEHRS